MIKNLIIVCLLCISVNYSAQNAKSKMPDVFFNCWSASYEEDDQTGANKEKTYRPCDYKQFKPSMYRQNITFHKDGKCTYLAFAPNDAHYFEEGKWTSDKKGKLITVTKPDGKVAYKIKIDSLKKDLMKLQYLEVK
jgi:hypothetical protein